MVLISIIIPTRNRKDLLKAIHYVILLMSSEDATEPTVTYDKEAL